MVGVLAVVAGVVFFILVARRLTAGSSGDQHGVSGDADTIWSCDLDPTDDGGWSWSSSDGGSPADSSSSSDSGSSWF